VRGWSELLLLGAVCTACWLRTPAGGLVNNGVAWLREQEGRDLLSHFDTQLPPRMERSLQQALTDAAGSTAELPPGWTPAQHLAVRTHLGEDAATEIAAMGVERPEVALELWAVGYEQRARAVRRATAAGEPEPERFESHRRFLPAEAAARADEAVAQVLALSTALDLAWPVEPSWRVSSPFGWRLHPTLHTRRFHEGIDLATPVGTPVRAAGAGVVLRAREDGVNGKYVKLDHGHGVTTAYCHGAAFQVAKGQGVAQGELIMDSGNTGRSSGPHLHFGLRIDGHAVDPALLRSAAEDEDHSEAGASQVSG
jgi:murein DD-endopeptidase